MSERRTTITLPGSPAGYSMRGTFTVQEAVEDLRKFYQRQLKEAQEVLAAADAEFRVVQHDNLHAWRRLKVLQEGKKKG